MPNELIWVLKKKTFDLITHADRGGIDKCNILYLY